MVIEVNNIKSKDRVKNHGEVFTPKSIVNLMIEEPEILEKVNDITATFLEPSAGEGAFVTEILNRRMQLCNQISKDQKEFEFNCLVSLSTIYGIELLIDNLEILIDNMYSTFLRNYQKYISDNSYIINEKVLKSARVIIKTNMQQGDTLKYINSEGNPIIFSEWQVQKNKKVKRIEFTFESIVNGGEPLETVSQLAEQLDLFDMLDEENYSIESKKSEYKIVPFEDVYKELIVKL